MFDIFKGKRGLTLFATILLIFYGIYYMPIDSFGMNAPVKMALMASSIYNTASPVSIPKVSAGVHIYTLFY